jgi:hypothetical protein
VRRTTCIAAIGISGKRLIELRRPSKSLQAAVLQANTAAANCAFRLIAGMGGGAFPAMCCTLCTRSLGKLSAGAPGKASGLGQ